MSRPNRCPCGRRSCPIFHAGYSHPVRPPMPIVRPGIISRLTVKDGETIILTVSPTLSPGGPLAPARMEMVVKVPKRLARIIAAAVAEEH